MITISQIDDLVLHEMTYGTDPDTRLVLLLDSQQVVDLRANFTSSQWGDVQAGVRGIPAHLVDPLNVGMYHSVILRRKQPPPTKFIDADNLK